MSYLSIDALQNSLAKEVFANKSDAKKAAGRALGTFVEIITYYLLREWGFANNLGIETRLPEYGKEDITHNVEFTIHKSVGSIMYTELCGLPLTAKKILSVTALGDYEAKNCSLLSSNGILKNSCIIAEDSDMMVCANLDGETIAVSQLDKKPFAMFECKRVGVEEGQKKGPQTIEKAKQGAYVAIKTSPLQKVRNDKGERIGIYFRNGVLEAGRYEDMLDKILRSSDSLILSFGIISNHGNWFTSDDLNKELKVLAEAYDRLLFLTDSGLARFITDTILSPDEKYLPVKDAFYASYCEGRKTNIFTKSKIALKAHTALSEYFHSNIAEIERWFNIITPPGTSMNDIKAQLALNITPIAEK